MIGFIGGGNMAEALIKGIRGKRQRISEDIFVSEPREERRKYLEQAYGIKATPSNKDVASSCDIIILAIKPQDMDAVLDDIAEDITEEKVVVSIAAGITLSYLSSRLTTKRLIRVMPNIPAIVQEGMSVISLWECFSEKVGIIKQIFMSVGEVLVMPEKYLDAVTALSGSGPAFIAFFIEAMIEGGVKMGLLKGDAIALAVQTALGTARLLDTGMSPAKLREMVTSPGGTTAAGLKVFEDKGLKDIIISAIETATKRSRELEKMKE